MAINLFVLCKTGWKGVKRWEKEFWKDTVLNSRQRGKQKVQQHNE